MAKKVIIIVSIIVALIIIVIGSVFTWYNISLSPINKDDITPYNLEIPMGSGSSTIAKKLKSEGLIKNELAFKIYVKLNKISNFQAGTYNLTKNLSVKEIVEILQTGKVNGKDTISITFVEGKNMRWVANKIAENTNNSEEDVYALLEDEEYINSLIQKYWFLTDDIKNEDIYYPLEGYLFPDTYQFENKEIKVEKIFETLLNQMDKKLSTYKEDIEKSKYSIHKILSAAAIIENEAVFDKDRKDVAGVIYNRLKENMAIQSDVTTYYAFKIEMGSRDLYSSEINKYNAYNTRGPNMTGKLPVGPISMVSIASIEAAINPNENNYIYFVADKNGKVYFTRTYDEHLEKVNELKNSGLWIQF
ncbi:MAG: endolytic transglycosylase MltG [Clostridia bacterium]|nr:endolytic transglycosylase MltG [Clostridia bacterium]